MHIVITLLYIVVILLLLFLFLVIFILLVPFRYRLEGGYDTSPWFIFNIRCSPAFIFDGKWDEAENKDFKARLVLFGIPIKIDPQKMGKKDQTVIKKTKSNKKKKKKLASVTAILDKEFRRRGMVLIKDLLRIVKPDQLSIKGKIGFEEPHYTGWLVAFSNSINYSCQNTFIDLEPVFEEEYLAVESILKGRVQLGLIIVKVGWFFLINRLKHSSFRSGGKTLSPAA